MKNQTWAIYLWSIVNIFVGGIICCAMIPMVARPAIDEINQESEPKNDEKLKRQNMKV
jgi:hypothetical protein